MPTAKRSSPSSSRRRSDGTGDTDLCRRCRQKPRGSAAGEGDRGLEVAVGLADLLAPRLDDADQLVEVVAQRLDSRAHLPVGVELDLFAHGAALFGERAVL